MSFVVFPLLLLIPQVIGLVFGIVIIVGALQMMRLKSHGLATVASIVALLPCGPAWFLGLPMGIWSLTVLNRRQVKAAFQDQARSRATDRSVARPEPAKGVTMPAHPEHPPPHSGEPRLSRFAIAGAVWALFGLLAVIPTLFFIALNRVWNGTALPTDLVHEQPPLAFMIFLGVLLAIGAGAPIGTTILGAISIGHIKRSHGKIVGLPLAAVDALFFPLLIINGTIFGVLLFFHYSGLEMNFAMSLYLALGETAFIGGGVSSAIVKRVWVSEPTERGQEHLRARR